MVVACGYRGSEIPGIAQNADVYGGREEGVVLASVDSMKGVKGYYFGMATPDFQVIQNGEQITFKLGESFVSFIVGNQRKVEFTGLPSRKDMLVKAAAFNPAGLGCFRNRSGKHSLIQRFHFFDKAEMPPKFRGHFLFAPLDNNELRSSALRVRVIKK